MELGIERFSSITLYERKIIKEWPKDRKDYDFIMQHIASGDIAIMHGEAYLLDYETEHICDCEFCQKDTENENCFFFDKTLMEKFIDDKSIHDYTVDDSYYFIRAVTQNKEPCILFREATDNAV